jgi:hypothetical protein
VSATGPNGPDPAAAGGSDARNPVAALNPYERVNVVAHLVDGGLVDDLHALLRLEYDPAPAPVAPPPKRRWFSLRRPKPAEVRRPRPVNAWHAAREDAGEAAGYREDTARAAAAAARAAADSLERDGEAAAVGLEARYALVRASMNSRSTALGPGLLVALVSSGRWSPAQALAHAREAATAQARIAGIAVLLPHLEPEEREGAGWEALGFVDQIQSDEGVIAVPPTGRDRSRALTRLAAGLNAAQLEAACRAAEAIHGEDERLSALMSLILALAREVGVDTALGRAAALQKTHVYLRILEALWPHLTEQQVREAFARESSSGAPGAVVTLAGGLARLGDAAVVLERIRTLPRGFRAEALARMAGEVEGETLDAVLAEVRRLEDPELRARTLAAFSRENSGPLAGRLAHEAFADVLAIPYDYTVRKTLVEIADVLSEADSDAAFGRARRFRRASDRVEALGSLAGRVSSARRTELASTIAAAASDPALPPNMVTDLWLRPDVDERSIAATLAAFAPEAALRIAAGGAPQARVALANAMAARLPPAFLDEAIRVAVGDIGDEGARRAAATAFRTAALQRSPPDLDDIVRIQDEALRARLLGRKAPELADAAVDAAADAALRLVEGDHVAVALGPLVPRLADERVGAVLDRLAARRHSYAFRRSDQGWVWLVDVLAPRLSGPLLQRALLAARERDDDDDWKAWALRTLVPHLPMALLEVAIASLQAVGAQSVVRGAGLGSACVRLMEIGEPVRALRLLSDLPAGSERRDTILELIDRAPEDLLDELVGREAPEEPDRGAMLVHLAARRHGAAREPLVREAVAAAAGMDGMEAVAVLVGAARLSGPDRLPEILDRVSRLVDPSARASAIAAIGSGSPAERFARAPFLLSLQRIEGTGDVSEAVHAEPGLEPSRLRAVLAMALAIEEAEHRGRALIGLLTHVPPDERERACGAAVLAVGSVDADGAREGLARLLAGALAPAELQLQHRALTQLLGLLDVRSRERLLPDLSALAGVVDRLGGAGALSEVERAIEDAGRWWP